MTEDCMIYSVNLGKYNRTNYCNDNCMLLFVFQPCRQIQDFVIWQKKVSAFFLDVACQKLSKFNYQNWLIFYRAI